MEQPISNSSLSSALKQDGETMFWTTLGLGSMKEYASDFSCKERTPSFSSPAHSKHRPILLCSGHSYQYNNISTTLLCHRLSNKIEFVAAYFWKCGIWYVSIMSRINCLILHLSRLLDDPGICFVAVMYDIPCRKTLKHRFLNRRWSLPSCCKLHQPTAWSVANSHTLKLHKEWSLSKDSIIVF